MFKIFINDGKSKIPEDDIFYVIANNGIFLKKTIGIVESLTKVDNISILNNVASYAKLHIQKIPQYEFSQIIDFFKKVYEKYKAEAAVLLYYNTLTGKYLIKVPKQEVSFASLDYNLNEPTPKDFVLLCSIHSHGSMSAFHSGTDVKDEKGFTGLHITIGDINKENIDICASITSNDSRFPVDPIDYIEGIERVQIKKQYKYINSIFIHDGFSELDDLFDNPKKEKEEYEIKYKLNTYIQCPNRWLLNVKEKKLQVIKSVGYRYGYNMSNTFDYKKFNKCFGKNQVISKSNKLTVNELELIKRMDDDEDYSPCEECVFRDCKVELQKEELEDMYDELNFHI